MVKATRGGREKARGGGVAWGDGCLLRGQDARDTVESWARCLCHFIHGRDGHATLIKGGRALLREGRG